VATLDRPALRFLPVDGGRVTDDVSIRGKLSAIPTHDGVVGVDIGPGFMQADEGH